jgi:sodium/potassium-transporting ATPase subunit alpha
MLLTIAAKRMANDNILVKDLQGVETLGAITLLATDKTGTVTHNQMTTTNLWTCGQLYQASGSAAVEGVKTAGLQDPGVIDILHISTFCSRAKFNRTDIPIKEREILGDATESGLSRYAIDQLDNYDKLADKFPKIFELPFSSETKWALSIHKNPMPTDFSPYI